MFRGRFVHTIDAKGRVSFPARYREKIPTIDGSAKLVVAADPMGEPFLHVYPLPAWQEIEAKIAELPKFQKHAARFRRRFVAGAEECEVDRSGRVLVPPHLREQAKLVKDVVWAGSIQKIELWAKECWEAEGASDTQDEEAYRAAIAEWI